MAMRSLIESQYKFSINSALSYPLTPSSYDNRRRYKPGVLMADFRTEIPACWMV